MENVFDTLRHVICEPYDFENNKHVARRLKEAIHGIEECVLNGLSEKKW